MINPLQGICQGYGESPAGWFLIIFIIILYLKDKGSGVEVKTSITGDNFKLVITMFVDNGNFATLGKRTNSQSYEVLQQHQIIVYALGGGLIVSVGHINLGKGYWYPIKWLWTHGNTVMLSSKNVGYIILIKRNAEQVAIPTPV